MNGYIGFYNGKRVEIYAATSYEARAEAVRIFKPAKSKAHMVHVHLAEKDGKSITHLPLF